MNPVLFFKWHYFADPPCTLCSIICN